MNARSAVRVLVLRSMRARLKGLLGRQGLSERLGVCLTSCRLIHTVGMTFPIDLIFLDRHARVVKTMSHVGPGRCVGCWQASAVIETAAGEIDRGRLACYVEQAALALVSPS